MWCSGDRSCSKRPKTQKSPDSPDSPEYVVKEETKETKKETKEKEKDVEETKKETKKEKEEKEVKTSIDWSIEHSLTPIQHPVSWISTNLLVGNVLDGLGKEVEFRRYVVGGSGYYEDHPFVAVAENFFTAKECTELVRVFDNSQAVATPSDSFFNRGVIDLSLCTYRQLDMLKSVKCPEDDKVIEDALKKITPFVGGGSVAKSSFRFKQYVPEHSKEMGIGAHSDYSDYTLVVYLTDLSEENGGCTFFESLKIKVRPKAGRALWFRSRHYGSCIINAQLSHGADPVLSGRKLIIQAMGNSNGSSGE